MGCFWYISKKIQTAMKRWCAAIGQASATELFLYGMFPLPAIHSRWFSAVLQDGIHQDRVLLLSQTHSTDLLVGVFQAKHIFINSAIIEISACCYLCHLHESKGKFSIHSGVRGSRTFCKLYTAGQMSCGTWGCEFVLTQPAVGLLPKLELFGVCSFQCAGGEQGQEMMLIHWLWQIKY